MPDKKSITEEQVRVYEVLFNMAMKGLLVIAGLVAFFIVLYFVITDKDSTNKIIFGGLDLILGGSTYKVYHHYFPAPASIKPSTRRKTNQ